MKVCEQRASAAKNLETARKLVQVLLFIRQEVQSDMYGPLKMPIETPTTAATISRKAPANLESDLSGVKGTATVNQTNSLTRRT